MTKRPSVGVGIMVLKNSKVLLGKRHSDPEKADSELKGEGTWTMPGGKVDFKETVREAAKRELFEETGIKGDALELFSVTDDIKGEKHFVTIGFLLKNPKEEPETKEPEEIVEWRWFEITDLPHPIYRPSDKILNKYKQSESSFGNGE